MVSEIDKAASIARLQFGDSPLQISADLGLPTKLVEEWRENLSSQDLLKIEANATAVARISEVIPPGIEGNDVINRLKNKIEETAVEIVEQVSIAVVCPDPMRAKTLQLLANTCSSLYTTIVNKDVSPQSGDTNVTLFQQLSKD